MKSKIFAIVAMFAAFGIFPSAFAQQETRVVQGPAVGYAPAAGAPQTAAPADTIVTPPNRVVVTICYVKASVFVTKLEPTSREVLSGGVGKDTDTFISEFNKKLEAAGHDVVIAPTCAVKDYEEGKFTLILRFKMYPAAGRDDAILAEVFVKIPRKEAGVQAGGAFINGLKGIGAPRAADEIGDKVVAKIKATPSDPSG